MSSYPDKSQWKIKPKKLHSTFNLSRDKQSCEQNIELIGVTLVKKKDIKKILYL